MEGRTVENVRYIRRHFALPTSSGLDKFFNIREEGYEEAVCLFYADMTLPEVPEGTDSVIRSNLLETPIEFSLSELCQIFEIPNEGEHVCLTAFDHLLAYGKIESEVYYLISINGEKPKTAMSLKPDFPVIQMVH